MMHDAIYINQDGVRLYAWIAFNGLVPMLESRIRAGVLPYASHGHFREHPALSVPPRRMTVEQIASSCAVQNR